MVQATFYAEGLGVVSTRLQRGVSSCGKPVQRHSCSATPIVACVVGALLRKRPTISVRRHSCSATPIAEDGGRLHRSAPTTIWLRRNRNQSVIVTTVLPLTRLLSSSTSDAAKPRPGAAADPTHPDGWRPARNRENSQAEFRRIQRVLPTYSLVPKPTRFPSLNANISPTCVLILGGCFEAPARSSHGSA